MGTKQAEIDYPDKLNVAERRWLYTKPFGDFNRDESRRTFQDFSTLLYLIQKHRPKASSVLELGCGPGWLSIFLAQMGFKSSGYDISPSMINVAKQRASILEIKNIHFSPADIEADLLEREIGRHDVVIIYDALHHCQSDVAVLEKVYKYLLPGGIVILAEPNQVHSHDEDSHAAVDRFGVTERGLSVSKLHKECLEIGFQQTWRYHASGQSYEPRHDGFIDSLKMIFYPLLVRLYYGRTRTRIWFVAKKAGK